MKQVLLFSLLLLVKTAAAQIIPVGENSSDIEDATFNKAIIHFIDGTDVEGIGKLDKVFLSQEEIIVFKIEEKDKDEKWTAKDVKGITIMTNDRVTHYEYLKVTKNSFTKLYEVVSEGNVTLYKKRTVHITYNATSATTYSTVPLGQSGMTASIPSTTFSSGGTTRESITYYVKRENEPYPTKIKDNYIKSLAAYMKDCDIMVKKIKNHEYNFRQLGDLVDYYNDNCGS